jgi:Domain of unknown function (DUF397)
MAGSSVKLAGEWRKSPHSPSANDCVEVAPLVGGGTGIRDSKLQDASPVLIAPPAAWGQALAAIKAGEFG